MTMPTKKVVNRIDSWKPEDDKVLVSAVLESMVLGKTKLKTFKEVGEKLERTASACGFRWNKVLSKEYSEQVKEAKLERLALTNYTNLYKNK